MSDTNTESEQPLEPSTSAHSDESVNIIVEMPELSETQNPSTSDDISTASSDTDIELETDSGSKVSGLDQNYENILKSNQKLKLNELPEGEKNQSNQIPEDILDFSQGDYWKLKTTKLTALHVEALIGNPDKLLSLLQDGDHVNEEDIFGRTALHFAASRNNVACIKTLVENDGDVNKITKNEENKVYEIEMPWDEFVVVANIKGRVTNYICNEIERIVIEDPKVFGRTPLHEAALQCNVESVEMLLEHEAEPNAKDNANDTPLLLAIRNVCRFDSESIGRYENVIGLLCKYGASVNVQGNEYGHSPLHHAAHYYSVNATRYLVNAGADILLKTKEEETPFHIAALAGSYRVLKLLLESAQSSSYQRKILNTLEGRNEEDYKLENILNSKDNGGGTPMHKAALCANEACISLLVDHGGDPLSTITAGKTVIDFIFSRISQPHNLILDILDTDIRSRVAGDMMSGIDVKFSKLVRKQLPNLDNAQSENGNASKIEEYLCVNQMTVIRDLVKSADENDEPEILQHPVIELFFLFKWQRLVKIFYFQFGLYVCFTVSLSLFVILNTWEPGNIPSNSSINTTSNESITRYDLHFLRIVLYVTSILNIMYVTVQVYVLRKYLLKEYETWRIFLSCALSFAVAQYDGENRNAILQHITSYVVIFTLIELMYLIGRFSGMGHYALMFSTVLESIMKALYTFIFLIIGFALSFYVQYGNQNPFNALGHSFVETVLMIMAEYDHNALFKGNYLTATSKIILLLLVILGSIALINILVGLAVDDTKKLRLEGNIRSMKKRVDFIYQIEEIVTYPRLAKYIPKKFRDYVKHPKLISEGVTVVTSKRKAYLGTSIQLRVSNQLCDEIMRIATKQYSEPRRRGRGRKRYYMD